MDYPLFQVLLIISFSTSMCYLCFADENTECLQRLVSVATAEKSTFIVYDESDDLTPSILKMVVNFRYPSLMYEYRTFYSFLGHHMNSVLQSASLTDYRRQLNFMLICGAVCIEDMMSHTTSLDNTIGLGSLLRHFSKWLIISQDPPPHLNITLDNVVMIRVAKLHPENDTNTQNYQLQNMHISAEMKQKVWNLQVMGVYSLLWMPRGREWSRVHPFVQSNDIMLYNTIFPNMKRGLNGRQLMLATLEWRPYAVRQVKNGSVTYTGVGVDVMDMLGRKFNFSYVIVEPDDMLWGQEMTNGSWTGVTGMIQRGVVETCPVIYGITLRRKKAMDFTSPVLASEYFALYRRRSDDTKSWLYFLSCFSWQVYLCGSVSLLWTTCLLVHMRKKSNMLYGLVPAEKKENMINYIQIGICIPLRQGILTKHERSSVRCLTGSWCVFCMVFTAIYTGNLIAYTTVDKYKAPFTTLEGLAQQDEYAVGVLEGDYAENMLMTTDDPLLKSIHEKVVQSISSVNYNWSPENVVPNTIQRVLDEKYVLISPWAFKDIIRSTACDVEELNERLFPVHSAFAFQRNSPLMKLFDEQVVLIRDLGIMRKLEMHWFPSPKRCVSSIQSPTFELHSLKAVAVAFSAGILLATVVLLVEIRKKIYQC